MVMTLSASQERALSTIKDWYHGWYGDPFRLFGAAGTGKTTLAKEIPAALGLRPEEVAYGTFTGKAAHVLRSKGAAPVSTIHSAIYRPMGDPDAEARLMAAREELEGLQGSLAEVRYREAGSNGTLPGGSMDTPAELEKKIAELQAQLPELEREARKVSWRFNEEGPWAGLNLIMLDEVSMVDRKMAEEIESYGVPVLVLGDTAQLPPIKGEGHYMNARPDVLLTEVHRTALENPITALATRIRTSTDGTAGLTLADFTPRSLREAANADQVIVWRNATRWSLVNAIRKIKGFGPHPQHGDKIMCLTNNKDMGVFNGQQFEVITARPDGVGYTLEVNGDDGYRELQAFADGFTDLENEKAAKDAGLGFKNERMLATYAQAITCHKSQGSEWPHVYVVNELRAMYASEVRRRPREYALDQCRKWIYTAVTRASQAVTITAPKGN